MIEKPEHQEVTEVLIIFPQKRKKITRIGGLFKDHVIDYSEVEDELKKLGSESQDHIINKLKIDIE
ncbi:MAG TPA: hypothetical protein ENI73_07545 [Spirochaetes bacterium]|nr:hypothetical protein [Spirochaetota bacterium]